MGLLSCSTVKEIRSHISVNQGTNLKILLQLCVEEIGNGCLIQYDIIAWVNPITQLIRYCNGILLCHVVSCGDPVFLSSGDVSEVTNTTEGAIVSFQCKEGLLLPSRANSTFVQCENVNGVGQWRPSPEKLDCGHQEGINFCLAT